ncbi:MAG: glycerophosphodiester phosphodiesterase family protein [Bacteroidales bacterium]
MKKAVRLFIFVPALLFSLGLAAQPRVIAHRGYWNTAGSAQNSITALRLAQETKAFGSEFDVLLTSDGVPVVNHDATYQGFDIQECTYEQLKDLKLPNGETLPTLEEYLIAGKKDPQTRLVLEIKSHKTEEAEMRAVEVIVNMVKRLGVEKQVDYISFSLPMCKALVKQAPDNLTAYLGSNTSPRELYDMGIKNVDFHYGVFDKNPDWMQQAKELNMSINVWTVNDLNVLKRLINQEVDYVTTDYPEEAQHLINRMTSK